MNRYIPALSGLTICTLLLLLAAACSNSPGFDNARAIKISVLAEIKNDTAADIRSSYHFIDSLPLNTEEDCRKLYMATNRVTFNIHEKGDDPRAVTILQKSLDILQNSDSRSITDTRQLLNLHVRLGATFSDMGMPGVSVDHYMRGLEYCTDTIYDYYKAMFYNNLGIIYAQRDMPERAEECFRKALAMNLRTKSHSGAFLNYGNLTELYASQGLTEKALETSQRSLDYVDRREHPEHLALMRVQQGALYVKLGQPDVAFIRYNNALKQYAELNNHPGEVNALLHIGELWLSEGQPDSAMHYTGNALEICRRHERDDDMVATLKSLSDIYRAKGDYRQSLDVLTEMNSLRDSLQNAESRLRLTNLSNENSSPAPAAVTGSRRSAMWLTVAIVVLLGAMILLLTFWLKQRHESHEKLAKANEEQQLLTENIDKLQREMTSLSLEKLKLHEGLNDVSDCLRTVLTELSPRESEKRDTLRRMLARVNNMAAFDADEEFKLFFERVHPNFYNTLSERFPELTPRDMRLCAFLYLGMTTKEIAVLTYREIRSVDSARNRLRKKLGLEINDDLTAYMRSI